MQSAQFFTVHNLGRGCILTYTIFVTGTAGGTCGEKSVMWRNFRFLNMTDVVKSEITLSVMHVEFQIYRSTSTDLHDECGAV